MQLPVRAIWVFHMAAQLGSISKAAEELSVTPSAVTQQIQLHRLGDFRVGLPDQRPHLAELLAPPVP